ncbi:MAG TPA: hypothetical protein VFX58_02845, partial [Chitinophagaceae bacterium]|nr:hypothetical protein [Chitinophagaceae bacterium]
SKKIIAITAARIILVFIVTEFATKIRPGRQSINHEFTTEICRFVIALLPSPARKTSFSAAIPL